MPEEKSARTDTAEGAQTAGKPADDADALHDRCRNERESMQPHETADCAGTSLAEAYENEEDGGS